MMSSLTWDDALVSWFIENCRDKYQDQTMCDALGITPAIYNLIIFNIISICLDSCQSSGFTEGKSSKSKGLESKVDLNNRSKHTQARQNQSPLNVFDVFMLHKNNLKLFKLNALKDKFAAQSYTVRSPNLDPKFNPKFYILDFTLLAVNSITVLNLRKLCNFLQLQLYY